jgi:pimeloyl-ACP methyl ester carboxylesterase
MPALLPMQRAPVDGGHVEYAIHGTGDPMLFIHGAGIADAFLPLVSQPLLAGIQQIHYRRRGYGHSTAVGGPPESFMARAAADAAQLLSHLGVGPAHVVGHST